MQLSAARTIQNCRSLANIMLQSIAEFGDLDLQQQTGQEETDFGALELEQAQVLFSAFNMWRQGEPLLTWDRDAAAEIEVKGGLCPDK